MSSELRDPLPDDIAISVRNLTKTYRLFNHPGDRVKQFFSLGMLRYHREFTALQDVSFDIRKGETVGIIGRNGSGKSTLLQLISGILRATTGTVRTNGRISALLELGAGFNPEFTGRENAYFQGAIQGLDEAEMDARMQAIISFADIGEFIDQPVRTYSSGMFVRLAFSVAVNVDPDILLVDEALAVGDISFQRKCIALMEKLREGGTTIILVSHNIRQVERFCSRALLLNRGEAAFMGAADQGCSLYQQIVGNSDSELSDGNAPPRPEIHDERITVKSVEIGNGTRTIAMHSPLEINICVEVHADAKDLEFISGIHTHDLVYLALSSSNQTGKAGLMPRGTYHIRTNLPDSLLKPGRYWIGLGIYDALGVTMWRGDRVREFSVSEEGSDLANLPTRGFFDLPFTWRITRGEEGVD